MPNRPVLASLFSTPVLKTDGSVMANAAVVAYNENAAPDPATGQFVYRRLPVWSDPDGQFPVANSMLPLDANGLPLDSAGQRISVYGDGVYRLCFWYDPLDVPPTNTDGSTSLPVPPDQTVTLYVSQNVVNVRDFGALGNANYDNPAQPSADDTAAIQAAIDYCLSMGTVQRPYSLFFPQGCYRITQPLRIPPTQSGPYGYVAIRLFGETRPLLDKSRDSTIYAEMTQLPAFMVQGGFGVIFSDLAIVGVNRFDVAFSALKQGPPPLPKSLSYAAYLDDQLFNYDWTGFPGWGPNPPQPLPLVGKCRDHVKSPYAAVVIDPFDDAVPTAHRYPGLGSAYLGGSYSTGIVFERCTFCRFIVGVMLSPGGRETNGEGIVIRDCYFYANKVAFATGQSQTRGCSLENVLVTQCGTAVDNRTYGGPLPGSIPNIRGMMVSEVRALFNLESSTQAYSIEHVYAESTLSIGLVGVPFNATQKVVNFLGCTFDLLVTRPMVAAHLATFGAVRFEGCLFRASGDPGIAEPDTPALTILNQGMVSFHNCAMEMGPSAVSRGQESQWVNQPVPISFSDPSAIVIDRLVFPDNLIGKPDSYLERSFMRQEYSDIGVTPTDPHGLTRQHVPPRARIGPAKPPSSSLMYYRVVHGAQLEIQLNGVTLKPGAQADELTFASSFGLNRLLPGDVVSIELIGGVQWNVPIPPQASVVLAQYAGVPPAVIKVGDPGVAGIPNRGGIGVLRKIVSGAWVIRHVPKGIVAAVSPAGTSADLRIRRFGRYHPATVGTIAFGSTQIRNVTVEGGAAVDTVWAVGDRLNAGPGGFGAGSYIVSVTFSAGAWTITMSTFALGTGTVRLYDADVYRFLGQGE